MMVMSVDSAGQPLTGERSLIEDTQGDQTDPDIATIADGRVVVMLTSGENIIKTILVSPM